MDLSILRIFNPDYDLHAGLSVNGDRYHYVLVAKAGEKTPVVLIKRTGNVSSMKIPLGFPVHAALDNIPSLLVCDEFAPHTPEEWVDQNEARIIPRGVASNEIINEWCVRNEKIFSGTITKKSFQNALTLFPENKVTVASLCLPIWDLAGLYGARFPGPFIFWKLSCNGSVIGYVENGKLCGLADFWAGGDDIAAKGEEIREEFKSIVKSLSHNAENIGVFVCGLNNDAAVSGFLKNTECSLVNPPEIQGIGPEFHEAYALALHEDTALDFGQAEQTHNARTLIESRKKSLKLLSGFAKFLVISLAALFLLKGAAMVAEHYVAKRMAPVRKYFGQYTAEQTRVEGLTANLKKKTQFVSQKSMITFPLTEFQIAFPEGVCAEEISFSEGLMDAWNCVIIANANTSAAIQVLINNISGIKGMSAVRMIYSEQTGPKGKNSDRAIKFRMEGVWKGWL